MRPEGAGLVGVARVESGCRTLGGLDTHKTEIAIEAVSFGRLVVGSTMGPMRMLKMSLDTDHDCIRHCPDRGRRAEAR